MLFTEQVVTEQFVTEKVACRNVWQVSAMGKQPLLARREHVNVSASTTAVTETVEYLPFSVRELRALKRFYAGEPARLIRGQLCDPWPVVARHRCLPRDLRDQLMHQLDEL